MAIATAMENTDRPPITYTVTYSDISQSGRICDSATILASSCLNETCCHTFGAISPPCSSSGDISISVFATSILGDGPPSTPLIFSLKSFGDEPSKYNYIDEHSYLVQYNNYSYYYDAIKHSVMEEVIIII